MNLSEIYTYHHGKNRGKDFSIMEKERGHFLSACIGENKTVLDIGCRNGVLTSYFAKGNQVTGIDIDPVALEEASRRLSIQTHVVDLLGDWRELESKKYDCIVAGEVLEHLYFPEKIIQKVSNHLVPGGIFVGSVPNAFSLKNRFRLLWARKKGTSLMDPTHINHFEYNELVTLLRRDFQEVTVCGLGRYPRLSHWSPRFFAFDLVWKCKK